MIEGASIVLVEDDPDIRSLLADYLRGERFDVSCVDSGEALENLLAAGLCPDLVILDWVLPGDDGLAILRRLRAAGGPPVVMLTAKDEDIDRVLGLEMGADDYVSKPFNPRVLLARIRAVLRRTCPATPSAGSTSQGLKVVDLVVDPETRRVTLGTREVSLTAAEFDLLHCFATRPGRVLSRDQLTSWTRGRTADAFDRTIDVQVSRLRRKLDEGGSIAGECLKTVRNAGYILAAAVRSL